MNIPRVAFFTDSFHEVNGVALTSRQFDRFAREHEYPFLSVHAGPETVDRIEGVHETVELARSKALIGLERDLAFDLLFWRHRGMLRDRVRAFGPDLVHITGPGHLGILGARIAYDMGVPLVASWHTNVHEFAGRRLAKLLRKWPAGWRNGMVDFAERKSLDLITRFYSLAKLQFAPNPELVQLVAERTESPAFLMQRGIDTTLFNPQRRTRMDSDFVVGYVGRLSPEKNVRLLAALERFTGFRFLIVGDGSERRWLAANMKNVELPGVLQGIPLAQAYANMDAFVFPSETDTFGNVVLEALASGVPAVVSSRGGPKFLVEEGVTGFVAGNETQFLEAVVKLQRNLDLRRDMRRSAREAALKRSWGAVFAGVYSRYGYLKTSCSTLPDDPLGGSVLSSTARVAAMSVTATLS